jgi:glucose/mannose transport system substrate-binding protein
MAGSARTTESAGVEILQHWGSEGLSPLDDPVASFERDEPGVSVSQRTVPVSKLRLTAKSEVLKRDPPALWVEWPGKNLQPSVDAGVVPDITDLWEREGLVDTFVPGARDAALFDGTYRCVPTDIYRINNIFYNVDAVDQAGVDIERLDDPAALLDSLDALADVTEDPPFVCSGKDPFGILQIWETLVLAHGGEYTYEALLAGEPTPHRNTIARALSTLAELMQYASADVAFVSSEDADTAFAKGTGALAQNGGWAVGRIKAEPGFEYGTDWGYVPFPGTEDVYQINMNALVPSHQLATDESVAALLSHLAGADSIAHIASHLGAVPPRTDVRIEEFHPVIRRHHEALGVARYHAPSMTHGLGVYPETLIDLKSAIVPFVADHDVEAATDAIVDALD